MTEQALLNQAFSLHQKGQLGEAGQLYRRLVAAEPQNLWAWYLLAACLSQQQHGAEALAAVDKALALNPDMPEALNLRGILMQTAGRAEEALAAFSRGAALKPQQPDLWYNRGVALTALGRPQEALVSFEKAVQLKPDYVDAWNNRGARLQELCRLDEALESFARALALRPGSLEALYNSGTVLQSLKRHDEAVVAYDQALAINPDLPEALTHRGLALQSLGRLDDALASHDRALAANPNHAGAWNNRGTALQALRRFDEAAHSYEKSLALAPNAAGTLFNHGLSLWESKQLTQALAVYDQALALEPRHVDGWNHRGLVLRDLKRLDEAQASFQKALSLRPGFAKALSNLASVLLEMGRTAEGLAAYTRHAGLAQDGGRDPKADALPHKRRHDAEQRDYLAACNIDAAFHLEDGSRLSGPAINPENAAQIARQWQENRPQIVVVDNLLTQEALEKLQYFCWGSTVWRKAYQEGYLGAMPQDGFSCPLLAQIAEELCAVFPTIFQDHALRYLWGFKYDSNLEGIAIHADFAAVNVNFWITPDDANRDPASGGLVVWDIAAPLEWDFDKYNRDAQGNRAFLEQAGAKPMTVPYRANRAVIFDSNLFHKSDTIAFKDGYLNRRINVTMLYGDR